MSFVRKVAVTYGTFVGANWLSNFILFPDKKLDYGFANRLLGREVNNEWWGTRTAHILTIALPLSFFDHLSIKVWNNTLLPKFYPAGTTLSFLRTPIPFMIHAVSFAFVGIMTYVGWDSLMNPAYTTPEKRKEAFTSKAYPELQGCHTMYVLPIASAFVDAVAGKPCPHGTPLGLIPPTIAFLTVKGFGSKWPWNENLTPFERKINEKKE